MKHLIHTLAFAATIEALAAVPPAAPATIVRAVPIVIDVCAHGGAVRVFTLTEPTPRPLRTSDAGTAVLSVDERRPNSSRGRFLYLSGTELLRGEQGTLTLGWTGQRSEDPQRGRIVGTWILIRGTGAYAGFRGRGEFVSDSARGSSRYRGILITAV